MSACLLWAVSARAEDSEGPTHYARRTLAARDSHEVVFAETPRWPETAALLYAGESEQASKDLHHFREHFGANKRCCIVLERSEEHTSELQSQSNLVCRLLLEKKKKNKTNTIK